LPLLAATPKVGKNPNSRKNLSRRRSGEGGRHKERKEEAVSVLATPGEHWDAVSPWLWGDNSLSKGKVLNALSIKAKEIEEVKNKI
jgi:hypothetical protein